MLKRTFSTILLLSILFCTVYFGGIYGVIGLATLVSTLALFEFYRLVAKPEFGGNPRKFVGLVGGALLIPAIYYGASQGEVTTGTDITMLIPAGVVMLFSIYSVIRLQKNASWRLPAIIGQLSTGLGLLYLPFMVSFFALLIGQFENEMNGVFFCVWILLSTKFTDVGGLLGGKLFGKHKLASNVSAGKTWEGVAGGVLLSMLVGAGTVWALNALGAWECASGVTDGIHPETGKIILSDGFAFSPLSGALCAIPFAATSVVSDLIESVIKRQAAEKDSGATIPGMGGALDLLDSLVLVAPVGYCMVKFVIL